MTLEEWETLDATLTAVELERDLSPEEQHYVYKMKQLCERKIEQFGK